VRITLHILKYILFFVDAGYFRIFITEHSVIYNRVFLAVPSTVRSSPVSKTIVFEHVFPSKIWQHTWFNEI